MIIKIFNRGEGNGNGPVGYVLSNKDHTGKNRSVKPEVLKGIPNLTRDIIDSLDFKYKYISGAISFRDGENMTEVQQLKLIEDFEKTFCCINEHRYNTLWIRHEDKGRLELHFVMPRVELETNKYMNIHPPGDLNQTYYRLFQHKINIDNGWECVDGKKYDIEKVNKKLDRLQKSRLDYFEKTFKIKPVKTKYIKTKGIKNGGIKDTNKVVNVKTDRTNKNIGGLRANIHDNGKPIIRNSHNNKPVIEKCDTRTETGNTLSVGKSQETSGSSKLVNMGDLDLQIHAISIQLSNSTNPMEKIRLLDQLFRLQEQKRKRDADFFQQQNESIGRSRPNNKL